MLANRLRQTPTMYLDGRVRQQAGSELRQAPLLVWVSASPMALLAGCASSRRASSVYTHGSTNSVNNVPTDMPVAITSPISNRLTAPAPVARISGTMPKTMAAVVIKTGRKRIAAASSTASRTDQALVLAQLVSELDDQDPVLADQPDQRHQAHLGVDIQRRDAKEQRDQRAADRNGTVTRITSGSRKLSNCAASTRKMIASARPNVDPQALAFLNVLARRAAVVEGKTRRRFFDRDLPANSMASAMLTNGKPEDCRR